MDAAPRVNKTSLHINKTLRCSLQAPNSFARGPTRRRGAGLFAVAFEARGLGAVTPQGLVGGMFGLMKIFGIGCEK